MTVRVLANLDAEAIWAGASLGGKLSARISALAPLLASLVRSDEEVEIWARAAVTPDSIRWDAIGRRGRMRIGVPDKWDLAWAHPGAKAANDRRVTVAVQRELGIDHASVITDVATLDALRGRWVAKAPWTAAGRDRVHGDGAPRADQRTYAERMLARCGALVVEPWLDRKLDLAVCARLEQGRVIAEPPHTLLCDARGTFVGIDLTPPVLSRVHREQLERAVEASGGALAAMGYDGPFTVDAFVWGDGTLHAPCEINARHSFGHVARALGGTRLGFGPPPPGATMLIDSPVLSAWRA